MNGKEIALRILRKTLDSCDPEKIIKENCKFEKGLVEFFGKKVKYDGKMYAVGIGKASCKMLRAVLEKCKGRIEKAIAITKEGYSEKVPGAEVIEAGHPLPNENSIESARKVIEIAKKCSKGDLFLLLLSGGGSSLFELPPPGISLEDLRSLYKLLLSSGMKIQEINTIRRHVSQVKGGKLMNYIMPAKCLTISLSDVVGDSPEDIASGPTAPDPTTYEDAISLLEDYGIKEKVPISVMKYLEKGAKGEIPENPKEFPPESSHLFVIGSRYLCEKAGEIARKLGLNPYILSTSVEGEAKSFGFFLADLAIAISEGSLPLKRPCCLILGGEVTVSLGENWGKGGPNQEVALAAAIRLRGKEGIVILSADTDGTDGPTDAAGGVVNGRSYDEMKRKGISPEKLLREHRAYEALKASDSLIRTGPTGNNLNDLYMALIFRKGTEVVFPPIIFHFFYFPLQKQPL